MSDEEQVEPQEDVEELRYLVRHPHDGLFGKVFSSPANARVLVEAALPPAALAQLDLERMVPLRTKSHSEALTWRDADLLFEARLRSGGPLLVRLLVEHQSSQDWLMAVRVREYKARDLAQWIDAQENPPTTIPPVLALVVANCEGSWQAPLRLSELYDLSDEHALLRPLLGEERYVLLDLSRPGEDELRALAGPAAAVLALLLMREVRRRVPDVLGVLERAAQLLGSLSASDRSGTFVALVIYSQATTQVGRKPLCDLAEAIMGQQGAQQVMTTAEQLMAEGRTHGQVEATRRILLRLIKQQLQVESLPHDALERIDSANLSELETWTGRVIGASSLDEILTGP